MLCRTQFTLIVCLSWLCCASHATEPKVIVHSSNEAVLSSVDLGQMLVGHLQQWETGKKIMICLVEKDPLRESAVESHTGMSSQKYEQHWRRDAFTGHGNPPIHFSNARDAIAFVSKNPGALALLDTGDANLDRVTEVPLSNTVFSNFESEVPVLEITAEEDEPLANHDQTTPQPTPSSTGH